MTPHQLAICAQVYNEQMEESIENKRMEIYLAAHITAGFVGRTFGGKSLPSYEKTFRVKKPSAAEMTDDEMYAMALALNAQFGGITEEG